MDLNPSILSLVKSPNHITVWNKDSLQEIKNHNTQRFTHLGHVLDQLGVLSAQAQHLPQAITSAQKVMYTGTSAYLYCDEGKAIGLLKIGYKKLFYRNEYGAYKEIEPLCVLDFYVHESMQRKGVGLKLFQHMIQKEGTPPARLAYDRPSPKLLSFLSKHYGLNDYIPQANNYVIYKKYFSKQQLQLESVSPTNNLSPLTHEEFGVATPQNITPTHSSNRDFSSTASVTPSSRTYVQYNPISHHFQQVEVADPFLRRTGRKRGLDFSPEVRTQNQLVGEVGVSPLVTTKALSFTSPVSHSPFTSTGTTRSQRPF